MIWIWKSVSVAESGKLTVAMPLLTMTRTRLTSIT